MAPYKGRILIQRVQDLKIQLPIGSFSFCTKGACQWYREVKKGYFINRYITQVILLPVTRA